MHYGKAASNFIIWYIHRSNLITLAFPQHKLVFVIWVRIRVWVKSLLELMLELQLVLCH